MGRKLVAHVHISVHFISKYFDFWRECTIIRQIWKVVVFNKHVGKLFLHLLCACALSLAHNLALVWYVVMLWENLHWQLMSTLVGGHKGCPWITCNWSCWYAFYIYSFCNSYHSYHLAEYLSFFLSVNKQLNDKERVAAALENPNLLDMVEECLSPTFDWGLNINISVWHGVDVQEPHMLIANGVHSCLSRTKMPWVLSDVLHDFFPPPRSVIIYATMALPFLDVFGACDLTDQCEM